MNWKIIKEHIMTGISFMVPVVVGAGLCQALGVILGGPNVKDAVGSFAYIIYKVGNLGMSTMIIPVICAAISYSIADKPGIAPGLVVGLVSAEIKAGFLGGLVGAFLVGYVVNAMKKYIHLPDSMKGLMPILIIPFFASLICGVLMFTVLGTPIAYFMDAMTQFLANLSTGSKFVYGFVMSAGSAFDFGGPVNKTVSLYTTAMLADGIYGPKACHMVACMIPPMGVLIAWGLSKLFRKPIYTNDEKGKPEGLLPDGGMYDHRMRYPIGDERPVAGGAVQRSGRFNCGWSVHDVGRRESGRSWRLVRHSDLYQSAGVRRGFSDRQRHHGCRVVCSQASFNTEPGSLRHRLYAG